MEVVGLNGITHLLRNIYLVCRLEDEAPLLALIVAPPATGKSFALDIAKYKKSLWVSDMTARGLKEVIMKKIEKEKQGYIIIPEFNKILSREYSKKAYIALENMLGEEGIRYIHQYDIKFSSDEPINFGSIKALTPDTLTRHYDFLEGQGYISRQLIIGFDYCNLDRRRIERFILESQTPDFVEIKDTKTTQVNIPDFLLNSLKNLSLKLADLRKDKTNFRAIKQVRRLLKAEALAHGRTEVEMQDSQNLFCLLPFFLSGNILSQPLFGLERQGTDAEYYYLRQHIFGEKWFGDGLKYDKKTKQWAFNRLCKMKLMKWENGRAKLYS